MESIKGVTKTGFKYTVEKSALNDYELIECLSGLEENPLLISGIINKLLGEKQVTKLKNHVRIEDGTVPTDKISEEITDIFETSSQVKNS